MKKDKTKMGRPTIDFDKKAFNDLIGLGCSQEEICWFFRNEKGKVANIDTLSRWCKREYDMTFQEYYRQNGGLMLKVAIRRNQLTLSKSSAAMAIFLGKNYLGQRDVIAQEHEVSNGILTDLVGALNKAKENKNENT